MEIEAMAHVAIGVAGLRDPRSVHGRLPRIPRMGSTIADAAT